MAYDFQPRIDELARKAGNPDEMGGNGAPSGRPMCAEEERDSNHPRYGGHYERIGGGDFSKHSQERQS